MDRPVTNSVSSSEEMWDRDSYVFPVPGNRIHTGSRSHSHSLLLAEALPSSLGCLLAPRPLQINILAFAGCLHCLRHRGWSFQAWHWPLLGEGVSFLAGASHGVWLLCKAPKDSGIYRWFSQVLPLQKLQSLPLGSGRAQKATRASGCSEGGEAQVLPHTVLHESVWGAGKGRATGTH